MAAERPWFTNSTQELEAIFEQNRNSPDTLRLLRAELSHRKRPRARKLLARIDAVLTRQPEQGRLQLVWTHEEKRGSCRFNLEKPQVSQMPVPQEQAPATGTDKKGIIAFLCGFFLNRA